MLRVALTSVFILAASGCTNSIEVDCPLPSDPVSIFASARIKPSPPGARYAGLSVTHIAEDSFWSCVGIRDGDTIVEVDSTALDGPVGKALFLERFGREAPLTISIRSPDGDLRRVTYR